MCIEKCALYLAVALFNDRYTELLKNICDLAGINFYLNITNQWKNYDSSKLYHKKIQNTEKVKENRKKLKQKNTKTQGAFLRQDGTWSREKITCVLYIMFVHV